MAIEEDDLPRVLARALVRAWDLYETSGASKLSVDVARPLLARHLVALAKEGMTKEGPLVAAGLQHLISLASTPPSHEAAPPKDDADAVGWTRRQPTSFRIEHAGAKFLLQWRVPWQSWFGT
jgi:hypothetical protein